MSELRLGSTTITFVPDGEVHIETAAAFPATTTADWLPHESLLDGGRRLVVSVGSFLIRSPSHVALVDLGLGPTAFEVPGIATYQGGALIDGLATLGVAPRDVDIVIYSHLHRDHVGWTSTTDASGLMFAGARHVMHRREWAYWSQTSHPTGPDAATVLAPLQQSIDLCVDDQQIEPGLVALATPGHTPGHLSVLVSDVNSGRRLVIAGDVLHTRAQLAHPEWAFSADGDPVASSASRQKVLELQRDGAVLLTCGHFSNDVFDHNVMRFKGEDG